MGSSKNILIVFAHPHTGGHCVEILSRLKKSLKAEKADFEVIDLYADTFDPVMYGHEHYTAGPNHRKISDQCKGYQQKVLAADHLVVICPVWWGTAPAILKGFFDKVFVSQFAFRYENKWWSPIAIPRPLLKGRKGTLILTAGALLPLHLIFQFWSAPTSISYNTLNFCGIRTKTFFSGRCRRVEESTKRIDRLVWRATKRIMK